MIDVQQTQTTFLTELEEVTNDAQLETLRLKYLGRKQGVLTQIFQEFALLSVEDKRKIGPNLQQLKGLMENSLEKLSEKLKESSPSSVQSSREVIDFTDLTPKLGHIHPITQTIQRMNELFFSMGFSVFDGPEVETEEYNFKRLNLPEDHPARDMQDTIYIKQPDLLLRTHTSSLESRALMTLKPPFRIVCPGRTYRNEKASRTNHYIFHQYECMVIDENITMADLFGTLELLYKYMYGDDVVIRFRSKYYPQVEPGVGPDMQCFSCHGKGCAVCKGRGWIEMGGGGMVHPKMLRMAGLDPKKWSGFAFGLGLDRWVMAKYNITDIRTLLGGKVIYPYFENESSI